MQLINYFNRKSKDVIGICRYHSVLYFFLRWLIKVKWILEKFTLIACILTSIFSLILSYLWLFSFLKFLVMKLLHQFSPMFLLWTFFFFLLFIHTVCAFGGDSIMKDVFFSSLRNCASKTATEEHQWPFLCNREFQLLGQPGSAPGRIQMFSSPMCHSVLAEPGQFESYCLYIWN